MYECVLHPSILEKLYMDHATLGIILKCLLFSIFYGLWFIPLNILSADKLLSFEFEFRFWQLPPFYFWNLIQSQVTKHVSSYAGQHCFLVENEQQL